MVWLKSTRFTMFHHEKLPSAQERYQKEILRVTMVMDNALEGKEYLVGNKCTYADLSFITWASFAPHLLGDQGSDLETQYPNYSAWMDRLMARPAVKKVMEEKAKASSH